MSKFDNYSSDATGSMENASANSVTETTLEEIQNEIRALYQAAELGEDIDEKKFDSLIKAQEEHPEYQAILAEEREQWRQSIAEFTLNCLERTRTFVPPNIFDCSLDDLIILGLPVELGKRILQRQCLWLVRMSSEEIARLHESDLLGRYNSMQQHLDIIETAAIHASLPDKFAHDRSNRKLDWRNAIEENLRQMLIDSENDQLPAHRIRCPAYNNILIGPVTDLKTVRTSEVVKSHNVYKPRRSFMEVCKTNSIMSLLKSNKNSKTTDDAGDDTDEIGAEVEEEDMHDIDQLQDEV